MDSFELLEKVNDRASFIDFVKALRRDRVEAEEEEARNPDRWRFGGALGWQNQNISSFLDCALQYFENQNTDDPGTEEVSWRDVAEFLYYGKIYE